MNRYNSITNSMRHVCLINKRIFRTKNKINTLILKHSLKNNAGRNNSGKITVFTKSSRTKPKYIYVDNKRNIFCVPAQIYSKHFDSNRSSFIYLVLYKNNICSYILGVANLKIGSVIYNYNSIIKTNTKVNTTRAHNIRAHNIGDRDLIRNIQTSSLVHCIERRPLQGGQFIRSAGTFGKIIKKTLRTNRAFIVLPSKTSYYVSLYCSSTIGLVSNKQHQSISLGKAGRKKWLGFKSKVRGVAMNPVDHPHGGGEGKKSQPSNKKSPWGKIARWTNKNKLFF